MTYNDLSFIAPPRISIHQFTRVLDRALSPAVPEADALYTTCLSYGIDPAVALAFFAHESSCGTTGMARDTLNWGNIRRGQGRQAKVSGGWAWYSSWNNGLADWCQLMTSLYIQRWKLTTVRQALPRYAPTSDGNAPNAYIKAVLDKVATWQAQDVDAPAQEGHLIQTYRVRRSLGSTVIVRAAAARTAAKVGTLKAGDAFTGFAVPGETVIYPDLGTSSTWISNTAGTKYVWSGLFDH